MYLSEKKEESYPYYHPYLLSKLHAPELIHGYTFNNSYILAACTSSLDEALSNVQSSITAASVCCLDVALTE